MSTTDELQQRINELEDRIEELEQSITTDETTVGGNESVPSIDHDRQHPKDVIADTLGAQDDGAWRQHVLDALERAGFDDPEEEVDQLRRRGEIYEPSPKLIKVV